MPVNVIGTLKPKNNGKFPVAEAVDIKVTDDLRLDEALENKADLSTVNYALNNKADKTITDSLQNQINNIIEPVTEEAEVINAREGADGTSYQTLKARLDAENAKAFQFRGELSDLNYTTIAEAITIGCYNSRSTTTETLSDKPEGVTGAFSLIVNKWSSGETIGTVQLLISSSGAVYQRFISSYGTIVVDWASTTDTSSQFRGELTALGYTQISEARKIGCYSSLTTTTENLPDKPSGVTGPFSLIVNTWLSAGSPAPVQLLITSTGDVWQRFLNPSGTVVVDWASSSNECKQAITRLDNAVFTTIDIPLGMQNGKFWDVSESVAELKDIDYWSASAIIPVSEGERYTISAIQGNSHKTRVWTLCDDEMTIIAKAEDNYSDNVREETFDIPAGATKLVVSSKNNISFTPSLRKDATNFDSIEDEISGIESDINDINSEISEIESTIENFYSFEDQRVSADMHPRFWAFESGTAVLTDIPDSNWVAVNNPIPVQAGDKYKVIGNQGASHKVRIWIVVNDDMEVLATASDHYESPNAGTLYTEMFTIPEGGTKLLLTTTIYADYPYITLYKAVLNVSKPLEGKHLSLLGDSISAYAGTIPAGNDVYYTGSNSGVTSPNQMWWKVLCDQTGMQPLVINGWSGSGVTQLTDSAHVSKVPMSDTTRDQALHSGTTTPDIVIIAGGVNDYTYAEQASQLPNEWDGKTAPVKGNSFTETYACMIKDIQTAYPNAIIICLSTWFTMRGTDNGYTLLNDEGYTQADYDSEIEKVAKIMRVPYINAEICGFNRNNFYPKYAQDSITIPTHPNANGQRVMGKYLANIIPPIVHAYLNNI